MNKLKNIVVALLCICTLSYCKHDKTTWDDDIVAPLANGNLTLGNLFPDTVIQTNHTDSSLMIVFNSNLINYQLDSLIKIPDTTISSVFNFSVSATPIAISPGENIPLTNNSPATNIYYLPNGIELRKAIIKSGKINFVMQNSVYRKLVYHYQLLSATKNNHILDTTFNIPAADSTTGVSGTLNGVINMAGYTIDFSGLNHNSFNNTVEIDSVHIASTALPGLLYDNQGITSNFSFQNLVPQYALGYFGSQTISVGPDTTSFNVFNSIKKGILNLNSANVTLTVNNQFGVAMQANISNITSINTNNPSSVTLTPISNVTVPGAHDNNGPTNPVVSISTSPKVITLNTGNSNVTNFIGNLPDKLSYKLTAQINPYGNISFNNDFGYYGTRFSADLNMNVPLFFSASNLILADTVSLNLSGISQLQNINRGNLILTATNSYPFSINLVATLLDVNKQPIGTLFSSPSLIQCPPLNATGKVTSPLQSKLYIPLTPAKISTLQKARYVYYTATFNTANQPNQVKFYNNYTLGLLLTADINYTVGK